jgi:hypothetical protein
LRRDVALDLCSDSLSDALGRAFQASGVEQADMALNRCGRILNPTRLEQQELQAEYFHSADNQFASGESVTIKLKYSPGTAW